MKNTHFYIAMPIYKVEKYLRSSVESALAQTYQDFEIIMVDDGSPDRCGEICDEYAARDARIHVIHKENGGVLSARVAAIQFIRTHGSADDFMVSLDPDDLIAPNALEVLNKAIIETGSDLIYFRNLDLYPDGHTVPNDPPDMPHGTITDKRRITSILLTNLGYGAMWRKAVRCVLLCSNDYSAYRAIRVGEDFLLSINIATNCSSVTFIDDTLYFYRQNPSSLTNSFTFENFQSNDFLLQLVYDKMMSSGIWQEDDYEKFFALCKNYFRSNELMYLKFFTTNEKKIQKLKDMLSYRVNCEMLDRITVKDFDLWLIKNKHFYILCIAGNFVGFLRFIYRRLKKHL